MLDVAFIGETQGVTINAEACLWDFPTGYLMYPLLFELKFSIAKPLQTWTVGDEMGSVSVFDTKTVFAVGADDNRAQ